MTPQQKIEAMRTWLDTVETCIEALDEMYERTHDDDEGVTADAVIAWIDEAERKWIDEADHEAEPEPAPAPDLACPSCDRTFGSKQALSLHRTRSHGPSTAREEKVQAVADLEREVFGDDEELGDDD